MNQRGSTPSRKPTQLDAIREHNALVGLSYRFLESAADATTSD